MFRFVTGGILAAAVLFPRPAITDPIHLTLAFFSSDRTLAYQAAVKPFVDAVNRDGAAVLHIDVSLSSALDRAQKELPQAILGGGADIAFFVPGLNPEYFHNTAAVELPGMFRDAREVSLVYTRLIAAGVLPGYDDFFVIGAYGTAPETIHSRKKLTSLADLKNQRTRVNNPTEAVGLAKLGALPIVLPFNETASALSSGEIDGATVPAAQLFDVGIGRFTTYHYLLSVSSAPLVLMMSRKVFDRLPPKAKALIRKYSGQWAAIRYSTLYSKFNEEVTARIKADPRRTVVVPSDADRKRAEADFKEVRDQWAAASAKNRKLMPLVELELTSIRYPEKAPRAESGRSEKN